MHSHTLQHAEEIGYEKVPMFTKILDRVMGNKKVLIYEKFGRPGGDVVRQVTEDELDELLEKSE